MIDCSAGITDGVWINPAIKKYCPDFRGLFIYGDYYATPASWFRLCLHVCSPEERALEGKECAPLDEIEDYFSKTLVGLYSSFYKASL